MTASKARHLRRSTALSSRRSLIRVPVFRVRNQVSIVHLRPCQPGTVAACKASASPSAGRSVVSSSDSLKGMSSRRLRRIRPEISGRNRSGVLWSPSYFAASCGGAPLDIIREYVKEQRTTRKPLAAGALYPRPEGPGSTARWTRCGFS